MKRRHGFKHSSHHTSPKRRRVNEPDRRRASFRPHVFRPVPSAVRALEYSRSLREGRVHLGGGVALAALLARSDYRSIVTRPSRARVVVPSLIVRRSVPYNPKGPLVLPGYNPGVKPPRPVRAVAVSSLIEGARSARVSASPDCKERPDGRLMSKAKGGVARDFVPWC